MIDSSCDHCLHTSGQWFSECVHCDHEAHSQCDRPDKCVHCHLIDQGIWAPHPSKDVSEEFMPRAAVALP